MVLPFLTFISLGSLQELERKKKNYQILVFFFFLQRVTKRFTILIIQNQMKTDPKKIIQSLHLLQTDHLAAIAFSKETEASFVTTLSQKILFEFL